MRTIVFLVEEQSMKEVLDGLLPKLLPEKMGFVVVTHEGKSDLERSIPRKLRAWQGDVSFVILRDQDGAECHAVKAQLTSLCNETRGRTCVVRVVCNELESWFLSDLYAVEVAFGLNGVSALAEKRKYRNPDQLNNAVQELRKLVPRYSKILGARAVAPHLDPTRNRSHSFRVFVNGIRQIVASSQEA